MHKTIRDCNFRTNHEDAIASVTHGGESPAKVPPTNPFLETDRVGHVGLTWFFDIEPIERRSRPVNWKIDLHSHASLAQFFILSTGHAHVVLEQKIHDLQAPFLIWIPPKTIHSLTYHPRSHGHVVTLGHGHLEALQMHASAFCKVLEGPEVLQTRVVDLERLLSLTGRLPRMNDDLSAATMAAAAQLILTIMVQVFGQRSASPSKHRDAALVNAFREEVDAGFTSHASLETYLCKLRTTERTLRRACLNISRETPKEILQNRLITEAKRLLLLTNLGSGQIADRLGFSNPAYFSRWFRTREGITVSAFREERRKE